VKKSINEDKVNNSRVKTMGWNWDMCPITSVYDLRTKKFKPSLHDLGLMDDICRFMDCPEYKDCWATKSTRCPTLDLTKEEEVKKLRRLFGIE